MRIHLNQIFPLFFLLIASVRSGDCPQGSVDYSDQQECIYPVNAITNYTNARQYCQQWNGKMMKINNIFENVVTGQQAQNALGSNGQAFIGVINKGGTWLNDDGTPLLYQNWQSGQPLPSASCAVLNAQNYQWTSVNCADSNTFICSISDNQTNPTGCPSDWQQWNGMCYYFWNPHFTNNVSYSFMQAEGVCQAIGSHLASIHSDQESEFLKEQILSNMHNNLSCSNTQAVIGLSCGNGTDGKTPFTYTWTDGTPFDYDQTKDHRCTITYGIINDPDCAQSAYWDYWDWSFPYARFICKKQPLSMRFV